MQAAAPENAETMADPGKAEPGRDIFAGEPVKDIKSSNAPVQPPELDREQKEISSVIVGTLSSSSASSTPPSSKLESSSDSSDESSAVASVASETMSTTEDDVVRPQAAAGPLGEAELEAHKVANELYPEAAKN